MSEIRDHVAALCALPAGALAPLAPIETEAAYDAALKASEHLSEVMDENAALEGVFQTVVARIAAYEDAVYPLPGVTPHGMLAYLMEKRGLSQEDLAARLGVSQTTVSRLASGRTAFTAEWVDRLSAALGVEGSVFLPR